MSRKDSTAKSAASLGVEEIDFDSEQRQQDFYIDPVAERRLVRKLDWKLIPWLSLLYLISFLDRTNVGNAAILGLAKDLNMVGSQFNMTLTIFFITYSVFEVPSNVFLKRFKPHIWLPITMVIWGAVLMGMGFVKTYAQLLHLRAWLGVFEAGLFPGVNYYLSCWYKRNEFGIRAAIFFSAAALSGSFGGFLAAGLNTMAGLGGLPGWGWIFIVEGAITCLIGIASWYIIVDFPSDATFLTPEEREIVVRRLEADGQAGGRDEKFQWSEFKASFTDWKTWTGMLMYMGVDGALYAFSLFLPTIIKEMGYTSLNAQLMSVAPYAFACILTVVVGWLADKYEQRGYFNIGMSSIGVLGFLILAVSNSAGLSYFAVFLGAGGIYPCISNTITWVSNNCDGVYRRGITVGGVIAWGNLNGVVSSNIYRKPDAPHYRMGHWIVFTYLGLFLLGGSILNFFCLKAANQKRGGQNGRLWTL